LPQGTSPFAKETKGVRTNIAKKNIKSAFFILIYRSKLFKKRKGHYILPCCCIVKLLKMKSKSDWRCLVWISNLLTGQVIRCFIF
jgi:hypothetical protein